MRYLYIALTFLFLILPTETVTAQQYVSPPVAVSQELVKVNGKVFYMHTVKKRETLFSISKAYGVTVDDITNANPKVSQGLKEGDYIYIPKIEEQVIEEPKIEDVPVKEDAEMTRAERRRARQTEKELAKQVEVEKKALANVEATVSKEQEKTEIEQDTNRANESESLQPKESDNSRIELSPRDIQTIHTVKWYESLSSIAQRYNISEEEILLANALTSKDVAARQKLRIPRPGVIAENSNINNRSNTTDFEDEPVENVDESLLNIFRKPYYDQLRISLQLPLGSEMDTTLFNPNGNYIEFYQGFLLALDDLRREHPNMDIDLRTHDMTSYVRESEVLLSNSLNGSDIIIGPFHSEQQKPFADFAYENNAIFISPIDSKSEIYTAAYPNFFQITTPVYFQQKSLLSTLRDTSNIILFHEDGSFDTSILDVTTDILDEAETEYQKFSYNIAREGRTIASRIEPLLSRTEKNHIIIASNSQAFVFDLLGKLNLLKSQRKLNITVYGTSEWRRMDRIDISYFHNLNLHIPLQYYVDYSNYDVIRFVLNFRERYGAEPSPFAFQAYDIASYFITGMYSRFDRYSNRGTSRSLLQSDYNFTIKPDERGFTNTGVRHLIYNSDFSTEFRTFVR